MTPIRLPQPLSTNNLYRTLPSGGRARSKRYREWMQEALAMIGSQQVAPVRDPVVISYRVGTHRVRKTADIDNRIKCLTDALVKGGVIEDDSRAYVTGVCAVWVEGMTGAEAVILPAGKWRVGAIRAEGAH